MRPTPLPSDPGSPEHRTGLCPACRSVRVQIKALVDVEYEVETAPSGADIVVVDERVSEGSWDETDPAGCPACGWTGVVGDLAG